jgi:hypothetical protein
MTSATRTIPVSDSRVRTADAAWTRLYTLGGWAALVIVLLYLLDIAISFGGGDTRPGDLSAAEWLALLPANPLLGLRTLGLLNVASVTVGAPLYFALFAVHRRTRPAFAGLALLVFLVGAAIYVANNPALPMWALSARYAAATADAERSLLAAAGEAILARGEDFTPGGFLGLFLTELAGLGMALVMLGGKVFSRAAGWAGVVGLSLMLVFTIWATFIPAGYPVALILATIGGLAVISWYLLTARRLTQLKD